MEAAHHVGQLVGTIIGLLLIASITLAASKKLKLPFTVLLVLVGIGLTQLAEHGPSILQPFVDYDISPGVILFVFLPTLIFESAFNLDVKQLRSNLLPVMILAIPGLILSTAIIGSIVWFFTDISLAAALLLGSILSATDPVAVISLFKQLGAPKRLTVLVEGESLFNDATSIVVSKILLGVATAGYFSSEAAFNGVISFFTVFFGGVLVGWVAALITGVVLGKVESDSFIEISLTTILAYFSFLIAEELFHVSGVMAVVAAGITMGSWGRAKISPSVAGYLEHFWEYLAYVANALIFLLVGLRVELGALVESLEQLCWVLIAMLISRALVIYSLVPLTSMLPSVEPVNRAYQTVMYWGGLRGAIALAIVLSLGEFEYADSFVAIVTGAVLFTLLIQGLSIEELIKRLGLDKIPLADRVARAEGIMHATHTALQRIPELQSGGLFSLRIAETMKQRCEKESEEVYHELEEMRSQELDISQERMLLFTRGLREEKHFYYELFSKGHLSESAYRDLCHSVDIQLDSVRLGRALPLYTIYPPQLTKFLRDMYRWVNALFGFTGLPERWQTGRIARNYEKAWGRYQASSHVFAELAHLYEAHSVPEELVQEVRDTYQNWIQSSRKRIDEIGELFPEFTNSMQEKLAARLIIHAQKEVIARKIESGTISHGVGEKLLKKLEKEIKELRSKDISHLKIDPSELLRKVPFFQGIPPDEFKGVAARLQPRNLPAGEIIIQQGEEGDTLFLIARGVIRVSRKDGEEERDLATLMAGDFFGEMSLLHHAPRSATCRSVSPCALYELRRRDFDELRLQFPAIHEALERTDRERKEAG
jgi:CPA1 family monovalent cation:H+ antiporter